MAIISADTADQAVAEEVKVLTDYMGGYCFQVKDVGTQNLHGLLSNVDSLRAADVVVVVAGTDIGLPSLVAGLVQSPVVSLRAKLEQPPYMAKRVLRPCWVLVRTGRVILSTIGVACGTVPCGPMSFAVVLRVCIVLADAALADCGADQRWLRGVVGRPGTPPRQPL